jgi:hypothetical protein
MKVAESDTVMIKWGALSIFIELKADDIFFVVKNSVLKSDVTSLIY